MNQILIDLGFIQIRWYSFLILLAFLLGYYIVIKRSRKQGISTVHVTDLSFYLVIVCILGARIYYCLFNLDYYSKNIIDIFKIWEGGLAIHGGIIAGFIYIFMYTKKKDINFLRLLDIFAPALALGQAIGRWGNFFNMEAYGPITTLATLKRLHIPNFVIKGMYIDHSYHHPTFFYESVGCFIIFIILMLIRNKKNIKDGQVVSIYFILYGLIRLFIEKLRQDSLMLFNFKVAQIVSILMILIGIIIFIYKLRSKENDQ